MPRAPSWIPALARIRCLTSISSFFPFFSPLFSSLSSFLEKREEHTGRGADVKSSGKMF